ncbi:hypothetical protein BGX21_010117, partial [Mortierella sp. AD011]
GMFSEEESAMEDIVSDEDESPEPSNSEKLAALQLAISLLDIGDEKGNSLGGEEQICTALKVLRAK